MLILRYQAPKLHHALLLSPRGSPREGEHAPTAARRPRRPLTCSRPPAGRRVGPRRRALGAQDAPGLGSAQAASEPRCSPRPRWPLAPGLPPSPRGGGRIDRSREGGREAAGGRRRLFLFLTLLGGKWAGVRRLGAHSGTSLSRPASGPGTPGSPSLTGSP